MRRALVMALVVLSACCVLSIARATDISGTTLDELKARSIADPATIKVAILHFYDPKGVDRHVRVATIAVALNLMRCGFQFTPELKRESLDSFSKGDAENLARVLMQDQAAVAADKEVAPDESLRQADAVRIGRAIGADWVVYGEVVEMQAYRGGGGIKKGAANIKIKIVDLRSGESVLSRQGYDRGSGGGVSSFVVRKSTALERVICQRCVNETLADLCTALPKHPHHPADPPSEEQALAVGDAWNTLSPPKSEG